jgi:lysozyme
VRPDAQAANFVTTVPRDAKLLPPAVVLDIDRAAAPMRRAKRPCRAN